MDCHESIPAGSGIRIPSEMVSEVARPVSGGERRPRVALLASYVNDEYEWSIVKGARRAVEARGGTVTCFAGGSLADPNLERRARTFVHDLVDRSRFEAVLCISSCVSQHLAPAEGAAWLGRLGLPVLSIGALPALPGRAEREFVQKFHGEARADERVQDVAERVVTSKVQERAPPHVTELLHLDAVQAA